MIEPKVVTVVAVETIVTVVTVVTLVTKKNHKKLFQYNALFHFFIHKFVQPKNLNCDKMLKLKM